MPRAGTASRLVAAVVSATMMGYDIQRGPDDAGTAGERAANAALKQLPADKSTAKKDDVEDEVKAEAAEAPPIVAMEASDAANAVPLPGDEGGSSGGGVRVVAESNV